MNKRRVISAQRAVLAGALLCALSSPAVAQQCSASAGANARDDITVLAILHTTDPNENGEGEPLAVSISNGGPTTSFSDYEVTHSFTFTALNTAPVTAVGMNVGFDGDESCEISVSVNAHHRFTPSILSNNEKCSLVYRGWIRSCVRRCVGSG